MEAEGLTKELRGLSRYPGAPSSAEPRLNAETAQTAGDTSASLCLFLLFDSILFYPFEKSDRNLALGCSNHSTTRTPRYSVVCVLIVFLVSFYVFILLAAKIITSCGTINMYILYITEITILYWSSLLSPKSLHFI